MAIPSLQSFILGNNQNVSLGHAHDRLREYFGAENIWNDPLRNGEGFNSRRHMCFLDAGGDNEWGRKFSVIEGLDAHGDSGNNLLRVTGVSAGSFMTAIAIASFVTACITGEWTMLGSIVGAFGTIGPLCLIPASYSWYKHYRDVQEISREELSIENGKITDLVAQILLVLIGRNISQELQNRVQHGQQN